MNMSRREWLILCGLALAAFALERGSEAFSKDSAMGGLKPGAEEYLRARHEAFKAQWRREADRKKLFERPEIQNAWHSQGRDRFGASPESCTVSVETVGKARYRGVLPQLLTDPVTGDELLISGGDIADKWMLGSLRVGSDGPTVKLSLRWKISGSRDILITVDDPQASGDGGRTLPPHLNDEAMESLARLFNCGDPRFSFTKYTGEGPITLDRMKSRYVGKKGYEQYIRDRNDFLDPFVDDYYASLGLDPTSGRLDPDSIPRPL